MSVDTVSTVGIVAAAGVACLCGIQPLDQPKLDPEPQPQPEPEPEPEPEPQQLRAAAQPKRAGQMEPELVIPAPGAGQPKRTEKRTAFKRTAFLIFRDVMRPQLTCENPALTPGAILKLLGSIFVTFCRWRRFCRWHICCRRRRFCRY
jgi:hypothetical protein